MPFGWPQCATAAAENTAGHTLPASAEEDTYFLLLITNNIALLSSSCAAHLSMCARETSPMECTKIFFAGLNAVTDQREQKSKLGCRKDLSHVGTPLLTGNRYFLLFY